MSVDAKRKRAYNPNRGHRVPDPLRAAIGKRPPVNQQESDMMQFNETTLKDPVVPILSDIGGAVSVPLVRIGDAHGLYRTLKAVGPVKADELADASDAHSLCAGVAGGTGRLRLCAP
ncbi:hypothetical protein [Rhizobium leguminosarum]|uniref:hypothetical protein n=1 Tax=Rhizobium leguminosarum TaxID=384 RepID=UPI000476DCD5